MCQCQPAITDVVRPSIRHSVHEWCKEEALRHKWIESEKAGVDIGFEKALLGWLVKNSGAWAEQRQSE